MKASVPVVVKKARLLMQSGDGVTGCSSSIPGKAIATALRASAQYASFTTSAAASAKHPGAARTPAATDATASKPSTPAAAAAAPASKTQTAAATAGGPPPPGTPAPAAAGTTTTTSSSSSSSSGSTGAQEGSDPGSSKRGGSGLLTAALVIGLPAGAYYAYEQSKQQYAQETGEPVPNLSKLIPPSLVPKSLGSFVQSSKQAVSNVIPSQLSSMLGGAAGKVEESSDKLHSQKQKDAELGFTMLPPEEAAAAAAAAEGDAAASAAARDAMSAAADEFPGSSNSSSNTEVGQGPFADAPIEHVDMTPIHSLFSEVAGTSIVDLGLPPPTPSSSSGTPAATATTPDSSSSSKKSVSAEAAEADANRIVAAMSAVAAASTPSKLEQQPAAAAAAPPHATPARTDAAPVAVKEQSDSELDRLCRQLGLSADLTPSGLIAVANAAGRSAISSSGTPVPPQVAQLNQAASDANLLGTLLQQLAARQAQLEQELAAAKQEAAWAEEAAKKREESLTEHFKELMREQSRIQQQITADAVKAAEVAVMADTARAHNEERKQRGAVIDKLRAKVNALSLAFDQRTAQVKSAHEVHKISLGVLALSKALEEGRPIGEQLQLLAVGCPGDPVVEAVTSCLPASAASSGLPTLQQLQQQFQAVAREAAEAAYFSGEGEGGVLARLAAKLAVQLKVEAATVDGGADSKLAQAKAYVQQGRLLDAADAISAAAAGTQAAAVVAQWVEGARARAAADQAVKLLQAHATTTATMAAGD